MYRDYRGLDYRLAPILQTHMNWARSSGELERKVTALRWLAWAAQDWLVVHAAAIFDASTPIEKAIETDPFGYILIDTSTSYLRVMNELPHWTEDNVEEIMAWYRAANEVFGFAAFAYFLAHQDAIRKAAKGGLVKYGDTTSVSFISAVLRLIDVFGQQEASGRAHAIFDDCVQGYGALALNARGAQQ
jgi:hypothetical protein